MKKVLYVGIAIVMAACSSSNTSFTTESGTEVVYVKQGEGALPVDSLISIFYMSYSTEDGKELMKVDPSNPLPLKIDEKAAANLGQLYPIFSKLKTGDSVHFEITASSLFEETFKAPLPDSIPPASQIKFRLAYLDQLTESGYYEMMQKKADAQSAKQITIDAKILDEYMAENNIEATTTESGLRYIIMEEGNGPKPEQGQMISVHYAGWILDGAYFDTSIKEVAQEQGLYNPNRPYEPYSYPLGGNVVDGWNEGLALMNEGSKARLYLPSSLGYKTRGSGPVIKPNSILVFDVELVKVGE
ncbi:MAG: FKBP-type peptidyl-prolyl cis-trans isomerase [Ekhidna sp.]